MRKIGVNQEEIDALVEAMKKEFGKEYTDSLESEKEEEN